MYMRLYGNMAISRPKLCLQLQFSGIDNAEFLTVNTEDSLHPSLSHFNFGTMLYVTLCKMLTQ